MEQKEMSIYEFKKGDTVTRIKPSKSIPGLADITDRSFIGQKLRFLGIANGCVYVELATEEEMDDGIPDIGRFFKMLSGKSGPINLPLDIWEEGWSYYIDPYSIGNITSYNLSEKELNKKIKDAIEEEDYTLADKLKRQLNDLKNK